MPKITTQQVRAVESHMLDQIREYVHELNKKEFIAAEKKHKAEITSITKEIEKVNNKIKKFNDKHKDKHDFYPSIGSSHTKAISWKTPSHNGYGKIIAGSGAYNMPADSIGLSDKNAAKRKQLNAEVKKFVLQLQLQEAAVADIDKFLKKLLK